MLEPICEWCGKGTKDDEYVANIFGTPSGASFSFQRLCRSCAITAANALTLARQVTETVKDGGKQLYIAIEKNGEENELLSVKRWSPLEPLENVSNAEQNLHTFPLPQE